MDLAGSFRAWGKRGYDGAKIPEITLSFWVAKIVSTAMGEATSDFLVSHMWRYGVVIACALLFLATLAIQFATTRYRPLAYWLVVVMVSIFGTMMADSIHLVLGVPYALSTSFFTVCLVVILWLWNASERTLSIHSVETPRREAFYWATVTATFGLGTAAGDFTASSLGLGYLNAAILFSALFALPGLCYAAFGLNEVAAFWMAYVLTRPMGASFADWFDKPRVARGLGYGTGPVAVVLGIAMAMAILYIRQRHRRQTFVPAYTQ